MAASIFCRRRLFSIRERRDQRMWREEKDKNTENDFAIGFEVNDAL